MQALTLPARRGWHWFYDGFLIFRKNQLMLTLLVLAYWMLMALVNSIPVVGQIAATVCIPALSVGLMNACRMIEHGAQLNPQVLFSGFHQNLRVQLVLGAIYLSSPWASSESRHCLTAARCSSCSWSASSPIWPAAISCWQHNLP